MITVRSVVIRASVDNSNFVFIITEGITLKKVSSSATFTVWNKWN